VTPARTSPERRRRRLRLVHLFPELLNLYGDRGNVRSIVVRAEARGVAVDVETVSAADRTVPVADLFLIGGGQDREQAAVAAALGRLGPRLEDQIGEGAALLAVCGGYQSLGRSYRTSTGTELEGPAILPVRTVARPGRLVGPVVAELSGGIVPARPGTSTIVGFENHGGRTWLEPGALPLACVEVGHGNNGIDRTEGVLGLPGSGGWRGLRVGTYLHGPLLPRNPHLADALIAGGLARGNQPVTLEPLDDEAEWQAHERFARRTREHERRERRIPPWLHRVVDPPRRLIGF
jgi:CobQ-like glutamine amidotransferase family enzyme